MIISSNEFFDIWTRSNLIHDEFWICPMVCFKTYSGKYVIILFCDIMNSSDVQLFDYSKSKDDNDFQRIHDLLYNFFSCIVSELNPTGDIESVRFLYHGSFAYLQNTLLNLHKDMGYNVNLYPFILQYKNRDSFIYTTPISNRDIRSDVIHIANLNNFEFHKIFIDLEDLQKVL